MSSGKKSTAPPAPCVTLTQCRQLYGGIVLSGPKKVCTEMEGHKNGITTAVLGACVEKKKNKVGPAPSKKRSRKNRKTRKQRRS
jgi:hypothetical protein